MKEEKKLVFQKNADKIQNRIIIPQFFINKFGSTFLMEVFPDSGYIKLIPIEKGE